MCGIIACLMATAPVSYPDLQAALKNIHHRGPDANSIWISDDKRLGLGHARLSIMDISNGDQPFFSEDKSISAIINGEFYEYKKIKSELVKKKHKFYTECDSEILIPLYQEYGIDCLRFLRGEFSFILWDKKNNRLFAARDRFGIKPLYYSIKDRDIYLGSEIKSLLAFGISARWNHESVFNFDHAIFPEDSTCFKDIFSLKPGHYLVASENYFKTDLYWDANFSHLQDEKNIMDEREYINIFREKLNEAVRIRLQADVDIGCYLSGGIDSSAILALAATHSPKSIKSFSISFDDEVFDESSIAAETARHIGAEYNSIVIRQQDFADNFFASIWHSEAMVINTHGVAMFLLSKFVSANQHKVVLTGGGADETLAGYQFFKEDYLRHEYIANDESELQLLLSKINQSPIGAGLVSVENIHSHQKIKNITDHFSALFNIYLARGSQLENLYTSEFKNYTENKNPIKEFLGKIDFKKWKEFSPLNKAAYLFCKSTLPGYILSIIGDRMEMAHSVEARVPFLDHHLFEFTRQLPSHLKIKGVTEKYILREATKDILPKKLYERTKQPFFGPPASGALYNLMEEVFNSSHLRNSPFYDQVKVLNLLSAMPTLKNHHRISADSMLVQILSSCVLSEQFKLN